MINRAINITQGSILLITPTTDHLIYRAALGRKRSLPRGGKKTPYKIGIGLAGHVLETRQPQIVANLLEDDIWLPDEEQKKMSKIAEKLWKEHAKKSPFAYKIIKSQTDFLKKAGRLPKDWSLD